jgi:hypothetical protein
VTSGTRIISVIAVLLAVTSGTAAGFVQPNMTPAQARAEASKVRHKWVGEISSRGKRGRTNPHPVRFPNPSRASFMAALRKASKRYRFKVLRVHFYKPLQLAPLVIVRSARPLRFSRDTFDIRRQLDPRARPSADDRKGWAYEGFYLEARDPKGVPFLAIFTFWRGSHAGGGQWARSEALYPFGHL